MQKMAIETNELLNVYVEDLDQRRIISANVSSSATTQRERESGEMDTKASRACSFCYFPVSLYLDLANKSYRACPHIEP